MFKRLLLLLTLLPTLAWAQAVYPPTIPQNSINLLPLNNTFTGNNTFTNPIVGGWALPNAVNLYPTYCSLAQIASDATTCIDTAINALNAAGGGTLLLPAGTIYATPTIKNGVYLVGMGKSATTIKQPNSKNNVTIIDDGNASLFGTTPANPDTVGTHNFGLLNLTIDGNSSNNTMSYGGTGAGGSCLQFWGYRMIVEHVQILNCPGSAWHSEWTDTQINMEGYVNDLRVDTAAYDGIIFGGPHDSRLYNIIVINTGTAAANTYYGIHSYSGYGGAFWFQPHTWQPNYPTTNFKYAFFVDTSSSAFVTSGWFEGGYNAGVRLQGTAGATHLWNTLVTYAYNGPEISLCSALNRIDVIFPAVTDYEEGLVFDKSGACNPASNDISILSTGKTTGIVDFTNSNGLNRVKVTGYQTGGSIFLGSPQTTGDWADFYVAGNVTNGLYNYAPQLHVSVPIVSLSTATYTVLPADDTLLGSFAGAMTITLPLASSSTGRKLRVITKVNQTISSAAVNIQPLVGGSTTSAIVTGVAGKWADFESDGTYWQITAGN